MKKRKWILVFGEGCESAARNLENLLRQNADIDGKEEILCLSWKKYLREKEKLTEEEKIILIGAESELEKEVGWIRTRFHKLGMSYGWKKGKARLWVEDGGYSSWNYSKFQNLYQEYKLKLSRIKPSFHHGELISEGKLGGLSSNVLPSKILTDFLRETEKNGYTAKRYELLTLIFYLDGLSLFLKEK